MPLHTRIEGTGHAVPDRVVTNDDLATLMDTSDDWIRQRTGIRQRHWITEGFQALEKLLSTNPSTGEFSEGDNPSIADICLVPQVYNAGRYAVDMAPFPTIRRVNEHCLTLRAFDTARPEKQPDAPAAD